MGIEPALSAWEAERSGLPRGHELRVRVSASDRERPQATGVNGTLLCLSIRFWCPVELAVEGPVEVAGEVALDAASDFAFGFAFGQAALDVGLGGRVAAHAVDGDDVQGAVELAVTEAVEPVPVGAAGGAGTGAVPDSIAKAASLRIRPAWDHDSRICAALSAPMPGSAAISPGAMSSTIAVICASRSAAAAARADDPLAEAGQGLVQVTVVSRSAPEGQVSAAQAAARRLAGRWRSCSRSWAGAVTMTEVSRVRAVLADWTALSRSHISSRSASRSPSARSCRVRAGQQLPGRADRVDRVALASPPLADMPGGVDLGDLLARAGQMPGQAQPVMPGALDRPRQLLAAPAAAAAQASSSA